MGHLVNPISVRLGIVKTWNSTWVSNKGISYSYLLSKDIELQKSLDIFFNKSNSTDVWAVIFDKALILRTSKCIYVFIILYSWKFFTMVDSIFDAVFKGRGENFRELAITALQSSKMDKNKSYNLRKKKTFQSQRLNSWRFFSATKKSVKIYSEILRDSFNSFKTVTIKNLKRDFFLVIFYKILSSFLFLRKRYLVFFQRVKDFLLFRCLFTTFLKSVNNLKYNNLSFLLKFKLDFFFKKIYKSLFLFFDKLKGQFSIIFFKILQKKLIRNCLNIFKSKFRKKQNFSGLSRTFIKFHKNRLRFSNKFMFKFKKKLKRRGLTFFFKRSGMSFNDFFFKKYLSVLIGNFKTKLIVITYLMKQNYLWLLFVLIKLFLRKNMAIYYGKRLWYIKSYIDYFFNYKTSQNAKIDTFFLFPSYVLITAKMISYVIRIRLTQKYSLGEILNKFVKFLNKEPDLIGFRITCHGRFTRRQRASHRLVKSSLKNKDKLLLNTFTGVVDYAYIEQPLKYGMCGIRIWLVRQPSFDTLEYTSILRRFFFKKNYKRSFVELTRLARCLRFLDGLYRGSLIKSNALSSKKFEFGVITRKIFRLRRYLKNFHISYFNKFNKLLGFPDKNTLKYKVYPSLVLKDLKKNMFLLY